MFRFVVLVSFCFFFLLFVFWVADLTFQSLTIGCDCFVAVSFRSFPERGKILSSLRQVVCGWIRRVQPLALAAMQTATFWLSSLTSVQSA